MSEEEEEEEEDNEMWMTSEWIHLRETAKRSDQQTRHRTRPEWSGSSPFALFLQFRVGEWTHHSVGSMAGLLLPLIPFPLALCGHCEYFISLSKVFFFFSSSHFFFCFFIVKKQREEKLKYKAERVRLEGKNK